MEYYISTEGSDQNIGSLEKPFKTLSHARNAVREKDRFEREKYIVYLREGTHYLEETIVFDTLDSGTEDYPVTYAAYPNEKVILSGGALLSLNWKKCNDRPSFDAVGNEQNGVYYAETPVGLKCDQLFINGMCQRMARYPNYDKSLSTSAYQGFASDAFSKERVSGWKNPAGGYIHAMHKHCWGGYHYKILGKDSDNNLSYEGGWQNNRQMGMHSDFRMVENIYEELNASGEWYHDSQKNLLYYIPENTCDMQNAKVEVVTLKHLIEFKGSEGSAVKNIILKNLIFCHAARSFMETKEPLLRSDWAIYRGGAVVLTGTEDIHILDCEFDQLGGNVIFVNKYNRRVIIQGCHIHNSGASGICFVGDVSAVRDPLFEYNQTNDLLKMDQIKGPKNDNYPAQCVVEDCLIHGIGRVERQPAGIQISMSMDITIRDTSVYDCARSGINIGDGCWGGHLIERCDVFDTVLETDDHGSFNSWGRDRFWHNNQSQTETAVSKNSNLPFLDAMKTTEIRTSRWRCDHGWDIDLDDGSTNYNIHHNLMLGGGLKLREGYRRKAWNNITVNNTLHAHVWYENSDDEIVSNIFMKAPRGIGAPTEKAKGKLVDNNFYADLDDSVKNKYTAFGWDTNSLSGDPLFMEPLKGGFKVHASSPALQMNFENFEMNEFGVKKKELKKIARTPLIPLLALEKSDDDGNLLNKDIKWLGATLHQLEGEEYSAYGVSKNDGGVAILKIELKTKAKRSGFREGDLIQKVNDQSVCDCTSFLENINRLKGEQVEIKIIRNQQEFIVKYSEAL